MFGADGFSWHIEITFGICCSIFLFSNNKFVTANSKCNRNSIEIFVAIDFFLTTLIIHFIQKIIE
jgi:hypothetical protein